MENKSQETLENFLNLEDKYEVYERAAEFDVPDSEPYIYFDINEIRWFTNQKSLLKHNNIHLLGFYKVNSKFGEVLSNYPEIDGDNIIELKFESDMPNIEEEVISAYGSIIHDPHPILVVDFFRPEDKAYLRQYRESLKFIRNFVPRCYFEVMQY